MAGATWPSAVPMLDMESHRLGEVVGSKWLVNGWVMIIDGPFEWLENGWLMG